MPPTASADSTRYTRIFARLLLLLLIFASLTGSPAPAYAVSFQRTVSGLSDAIRNVLNVRPSDTTNWRIGLGPSIGPAFEGAREYKIVPAPVISLRYRDVLKVDNNNIDFTAFDQVIDFGDAGQGKFEVGPEVSLDFGRHESDSSALRGLGNIGISVEVGGFVDFKLGPVAMNLTMTQDIANGHHGATMDITSSVAAYQTSTLTIAPTVVLTWATARYMKSFFGITETQSRASGLPTFQAGTGLKDVSLGMLGSYDLSRHWSIFSDIGYKRMLGDAADSPLVELRGSVDQWHGSVFVVYAF